MMQYTQDQKGINMSTEMTGGREQGAGGCLIKEGKNMVKYAGP